MFIHQQSLYINDNSSIVSNLSNIVSPSFYQPCDKNIVPCRVCNVEHMTVEDTSVWIWTFSHHKGWDEAAVYAEKFQEQEITGPLLSYLDHNALEQCMKITNPSHRVELLSAISYLFSQSPCLNKNVASWVQASASSPPNHCGIIYPVQLVNNTGSSVYDSQNSLSTFVSQSDCESSVLSTPVSWRPLNRRSENGSNISNITCLLSTVGDRSDCDTSVALSQNGSLGTDLCSWAQTDTSVVSDSERCRRISGAGYMDLEGSGMSSKNLGYSQERMHNSNTHDIQMADKSALAVPHGHSKPVSNKKKYPPRPCPTNHIKYRALADLWVRRGKSLRGNLIKGVVEKGESVWVDQVKGRRARVMNRGWVSLYTTDGAPLLIQEGVCDSK